MSIESAIDVIEGNSLNGGLGQYRSAELGRKIASLVKSDIERGVPCRIDMSDIDTTTRDFLVALTTGIYDGEYEFKWIDDNVSAYFGKTEIGLYYKQQYNRFIYAAKVKFNKEHGIADSTSVEKVDVCARDVLKMENLVFSWQAKPIYDKALKILREGKAVRFDMTRKGKMNMDFLHSLLVGFYTGRDITLDEIRGRVFFKWDNANRVYDKNLFVEFKEMMAAFAERQRQLAETRNRKLGVGIEKKADEGDGGEGEIKIPLKPTFERVTEDKKPRRKKSGFQRQQEEEDYEDWENWK